MRVLTPAEIAYLGGQRLGRIATVGPTGQPHAVPVGFRYNEAKDTIDIGGHGVAQSQKFPDAAGEPPAALVVRRLATASPQLPAGHEDRRRAAGRPPRAADVRAPCAP